jgi:hypothetical protein
MTPAGGVLTAVIGGTGRYLLSRISALEQTDNARITANPKVATLDNVEAVMDNKQTFYVPVQGFESGSLYSVSAGVALRVLPSIVSEDGKPQIRLDVHIEDGRYANVDRSGPEPAYRRLYGGPGRSQRVGRALPLEDPGDRGAVPLQAPSRAEVPAAVLADASYRVGRGGRRCVHPLLSSRLSLLSPAASFPYRFFPASVALAGGPMPRLFLHLAFSKKKGPASGPVQSDGACR